MYVDYAGLGVLATKLALLVLFSSAVHEVVIVQRSQYMDVAWMRIRVTKSMSLSYRVDCFRNASNNH